MHAVSPAQKNLSGAFLCKIKRECIKKNTLIQLQYIVNPCKMIFAVT